VADPKNLLPVIDRFKTGRAIEKIVTVTVVDADLWEARDMLGALFFHQIESADVVILNKIDLVDIDRVEELVKGVREIVGGSAVIPALYGRIDLGDIVSEERRSADAPGALPRGGGSQGERGYVSLSFIEERPIDHDRFLRFLDAAPFNLFRIKGPVFFGDGTRLLNYVGGKIDWSDWGEEKKTRLSLIGWEVDEGALMKQLADCVVP
jgi:G3E family GTPase